MAADGDPPRMRRKRGGWGQAAPWAGTVQVQCECQPPGIQPGTPRFRDRVHFNWTAQGPKHIIPSTCNHGAVLCTVAIHRVPQSTNEESGNSGVVLSHFLCLFWNSPPRTKESPRVSRPGTLSRVDPCVNWRHSALSLGRGIRRG